MDQHLVDQMRQYYAGMTRVRDGLADKQEDQRFRAMRTAIYKEMDALLEAQPRLHPSLLKSRLHSLIAEHFEPVIFPGNPFFFEMGVRDARSWGMGNFMIANWQKRRLLARTAREHPLYTELERHFSQLFDPKKTRICGIHTPFDSDHTTLGTTKLFRVGVRGIMQEARERLHMFTPGTEQHDFCLAALESCEALLKAAKKFSRKAEELLQQETDTTNRKYLKMIRDTADHIPEQPPKTFYEGLCMLLFMREAVAGFENMGVSNLGHMDRLLGELYSADLTAGRLTEAEARELVGLWMMHTDIKFGLEDNDWPETSTCIQLGGCDADGNVVWNDVTRIFIEEHQRNAFVNPKLNCRYSSRSPREYLELIGKAVLAGHNNFVLINDEVIISGLVGSGVELNDARLYVNGGCQETMIEGNGHTEGAALYVSVAKLLDIFLRPDVGTEYLKSVRDAVNFEDFYEQFLCVLEQFFRIMTDQRNTRFIYSRDAFAAPMFSATQNGCIDSGKDFSQNGAKYNFSTIALVGLATVADSLLAVQKLVYETHTLTLQELNQVLADNWQGHEQLRKKAISLPKYAHGDQEADALADRLLGDLCGIVKQCKNARGGNYIPSLFVYYYYQRYAPELRATPDGRCNGDYLSPGCAPSQVRPSADVTTPANSMANIDFTACGGGNAVLDIMLPASTGVTPQIFVAFARSCCQFGCPTLQPNVVRVEDLLDAKVNPQRHKDLVVRISGLSAYFIALKPDVQDEIISRNIYKM